MTEAASASDADLDAADGADSDHARDRLAWRSAASRKRRRGADGALARAEPSGKDAGGGVVAIVVGSTFVVTPETPTHHRYPSAATAPVAASAPPAATVLAAGVATTTTAVTSAHPLPATERANNVAKWLVYVRSRDGTSDLSTLVSKVRFVIGQTAVMDTVATLGVGGGVGATVGGDGVGGSGSGSGGVGGNIVGGSGGGATGADEGSRSAAHAGVHTGVVVEAVSAAVPGASSSLAGFGNAAVTSGGGRCGDGEASPARAATATTSVPNGGDVIDIVTPPFHITRRSSGDSPVSVGVHIFFHHDALPPVQTIHVLRQVCTL